MREIQEETIINHCDGDQMRVEVGVGRRAWQERICIMEVRTSGGAS